jgi:4-hydroxybenzoate polyprenyltransferase
VLERLWIYQRERFPLVLHAPVIAAIALSATSFSMLARQQSGTPGLKQFLVAFLSSLAFFFQLRVADEWKDFADDARFRPYRPVPRGLISLRELSAIALAAGSLQLALAFWLDARLLGWLMIVWAYMLLMTKEFFVGEWLRLRPLAYMGSHMLIVPLIYLYSVACAGAISEWSARLPLVLLLLAGFFSGIVIEVGRKLRAPEDEELGVATYSATWGVSRSVTAWNIALLLAGVSASVAAGTVGALRVSLAILLPAAAIAISCAALYQRKPTPRRARLMEAVSGGWALLLYLTLGPLAALWKIAHQVRHV